MLFWSSYLREITFWLPQEDIKREALIEIRWIYLDTNKEI